MKKLCGPEFYTQDEVKAMEEAYAERVWASVDEIIPPEDKAERKIPPGATAKPRRGSLLGKALLALKTLKPGNYGSVSERREALFQYVRAYSNSFEASKGQHPSRDDLLFARKASADKIRLKEMSLPHNFKTAKFKAAAQLPVCDKPHLSALFSEGEVRRYMKLPPTPLPPALVEHLKKPNHKGVTYTPITKEKALENLPKGMGSAPREINIGTILARQLKHANTEGEREYLESLQQQYATHRAAKALTDEGAYMIVLSRDPEDIMRCGTGRSGNLVSCMSEDSTLNYNRKLPHVITQGGVIAYLVPEGDTDIHDGISRVFLSVYHSKEGDVALLPERVIGLQDERFRHAIEGLVGEINAGKKGQYALDDNCYLEFSQTGLAFLDEKGMFIKRPKEHNNADINHNLKRFRDPFKTAEDLLDFTNVAYEKEGDRIMVEGPLTIDLPLKILPDMRSVWCDEIALTGTHVTNIDLQQLPEASYIHIRRNENLVSVNGSTDGRHVILDKNYILTGIQIDASSCDNITMKDNLALLEASITGTARELSIRGSDQLQRLELENPPGLLSFGNTSRFPVITSPSPEVEATVRENLAAFYEYDIHIPTQADKNTPSSAGHAPDIKIR